MSVSWPFAPHRRWESKVSAFVDGELGAPASQRFAHHLAGCERCRLRVQDLRQVKALLAALPEAPAPRSFAITPAMLTAPQLPAPPAPAPQWAFRGAQVLAGAALAAFFVLVAVDFSTSSNSHGGTTSQAAPVADARAPEAPIAQTEPGTAPIAAATAAKGIASPPGGGGVGAQAVPSGAPPTPAAGRAEAQTPPASPTTFANAYGGALSAPTGQPAAADGPLPLAVHQADDARAAPYRALEFGLLGLGSGAAVVAFILYRRNRRS